MHRSRLCCVAVLAGLTLACATAPAVDRRVLDEGWEFRQVEGDAWRPASVPGAVHTDLLEAGVIEDPFFRDNEQRLQWIEQDAWQYRTAFEPSPAMLRADHHELVFHGLDTYAEVRLNDVEVLRADNMFRRWETDVTGLLRPGENRLEVTFLPPVASARPALEAQGFALPVHNEPTRPFTRKAAYHYGWDWGPRLVTSGIWRPVELRAWSGLRIRDLHVLQRGLTDDRAELTVRLEVESDGAEKAAVEVSSPDGSFETATLTTGLHSGVDTVEVDLVVANPRRWWPHGLGDAQRYEVQASVASAGRRDVARRRIGLRTVELVREKDDVGESFRFEVNGAPVFMKGANYVPLDHFSTRADGEDYRRLFEAVTGAHMNMLRVWGGGIYEDDLFYDLADAYGVLIWQDFMFANAMVPVDAAFLSNVEAEARDQVRRLRHHPSLALWCGNNEIDEAWHNWGWQEPYTAEQVAAMWRAYERVFQHLLPEVVAEEDPGRAYWPSSPSIGWGAAESLARGDSHYWGVWHGREPFAVLEEKLPRFASEFGFQSYPSMATVEAFTRAEDRQLDSAVMAAHQKHGAGPEIVREYMARWYRPPRDFASFLFVSQLLQAEGMRVGIEAQRRAMPRTMGTLYWQLNDTWPVASWSGLDYYGRWKALHYAVRAAFAPVLVSPTVRDGSLEVRVVSDRRTKLEGRLELRLLGFDGSLRGSRETPVALDATSSSLVFSEDVGAVLGASDAASVVLHAQLFEGGEAIADTLFYFVRPKGLDLPPADVRAELERDGDTARLRLTSDVLAKNVLLTYDGEDAVFGDNYFDLLPGRERIVPLKLDGGAAVRDDAILVRTLRDTY
jgi:beta-mannosidase